MNNSSGTILDLTSNYQYVGFGSTAVTVNCLILTILLINGRFLKKSALIIGLVIGDLMNGLSLLASGSVRIVRAMNGTLSISVHPFYCFSYSYTSLFLLGNQIPGVMFLLIGFERFLAVKYFDWYRTKWTPKMAWILTMMAHLYVSISLSVAAITVYSQPNDNRVTVTCGTPNVVGLAYSVYNYGISVIGGTVSTVCTLTAMIIFTRRHRRLTANPLVSNQIKNFVKSQWSQTRAMLILSILDLAMVVFPNVLAIIVSAFNATNVKLGNLSQMLSCSRSFLNIIIYISVNHEFRKAALKLLCCKKDKAYFSHAVHPDPVSNVRVANSCVAPTNIASQK